MNWHEWLLEDFLTDDKVTLGVGPLPKRKAIALYVTQDTVSLPLAYFRDEESARIAMALIGKIASATEFFDTTTNKKVLR